MDRTEVDTLCEDFLGEGLTKTEDVADNDGYIDYHDDSPATHETLDYDVFNDDRNDSDFERFSSY